MNMRKDNADMTAARSPFRLKPLTQAVQVALLPTLVAGLVSADVAAAPTGGQVRAGSAQISHDAAHGVTTVKQRSARTAIDWQSFNVAKGEQVRFKQPNAKAVALNRIFDQKPSEIFGQVKANGQVVLLNPNGVFFRPGAQVNVGGLIAGAMRVGVDEFMSGRYKLQAQDGSDGRVVNQGTLTAAEGGEIALVGKSVANEGVIMATAGRVSLLAGEQTTVDFDGDGLLRFKVDKAVLDNAAKLEDQVANSGQISADGGQIMITARAAADVFDKSINNSGVIKAGRIEKSGGRILLTGVGPTSSVLNTGSIDASAARVSDDGGSIKVRGDAIENRGALTADARQGQGGSIEVTAESKATFNQGSEVSATSSRGKGGRVKASAAQLAFNFDAAVDVSGGKGGGEALLGGDLHGANPAMRNAQQVFVASNVDIKADATAKGEGGKVVVWSDDITRFHGSISARGGAQGGNGGMVEVSGKQHLLFAGAADTSAPFGTLGTLLLDPTVLHIRDTGGAGQEDGFLPSVDEVDDSAGAGQVDSVSWSAINALGPTAQVVLTATNDITIENMSGGTTTLTLAAGGTLTVTSTLGNILFNTTTDTLKTSGGAVTFNTLVGGMTLGNFDTTVSGGNGALNFNSAGNLVFGNIKTGGAALTVDIASGKSASQRAATTLQGSTSLIKAGLGTLTLDQSNSYVGATTINNGVLAVTLADALGGSGGASGTTVNSGGVLEINNVAIAAEPIRLAGGTLRGSGVAPSVDSDIALTANSIIDVTGAELVLNGVISGVGFGIEKKSAGLLTLNDASSYSGTTIITDGSIIAGVDNVFANSVLNIAGATARFEMETTNQRIAGLAGNGVVSNDEPGANLVTLTIDGGGGQTFSGTFFDNTADDISVVKTGAGAQTFSIGAATFAGDLTIDDGTLSITTANGLGEAAKGTVVEGNGTLNLNNLSLASLEAIEISGSGIGNIGALTATGTSSIAASNTLLMGADATIGGGGTLTLLTVLDNDGARALTKTGSGTLILAADNSASFVSATGTITINAGAIKVTDAGALGDALGGTTIANDAVLEFALGGSATVTENLSFEGNGAAAGAALIHSAGNTLTLTGSITLTNVALANDATVSVSNAAGVMKVNGISDGLATLGLTKIGAGAL
ncbi:MAG: filamentous hemagglutinin N-terminal domain-containing protein, partial [Gammaproteobacteria bacterium]|nr:filamentous hemagglutinin N-terminal domain-containing protein [Gammaproteobacteria bacterium]